MKSNKSSVTLFVVASALLCAGIHATGCIYDECTNSTCARGLVCVKKNDFYSQCLESESVRNKTGCAQLYQTIGRDGDECCNPVAVVNDQRCYLPCQLATQTPTAAPTPAPTLFPVPEECTATGVNLELLNYALFLERLEDAFYRSGLQNFTQEDFNAAGVPPYGYNETLRVGWHEAIHVQTLEGVIASRYGAECVIQACNYSFPVHSVIDFLALARLLESTGTSAYTGAIALFESSDLETAAAAILAVESSHSAFLNLLNAATASPNAFAQPLDIASVLELASPLFVECPTSPGVGNPSLQILEQTETNVTVTYNNTGGKFCAFTHDLVVEFFALQNGVCDLPPIFSGAAYLFISSDNNATALSTSIVAGPAVVYFNLGLGTDPIPPNVNYPGSKSNLRRQ